MNAPPSPRRAVFADRDGTIIEDRHYIADPAAVTLIPGATDALLRLREMGFALVVVTNQSGIGRGLYTQADYHRVAAEVARQLADAGVVMDGTYFCPDGPGGSPDTTCRKPSPVMYRRAAADLGLATAGSYYVGDKRSDVLPAQTLGGTGILVRTGHGGDEEHEVAGSCHVVDDLAAAAALIERLERGADRLQGPRRPPDDG